MVKIGDSAVINGKEQTCKVISKDYKQGTKIVVCESKLRFTEKEWLKAIEEAKLTEDEQLAEDKPLTQDEKLDSLKAEYELVLGVSVPKNKSKDAEWLSERIVEARAENKQD